MQPDKFTQKSQEAIAATLELARSHRNPEAAPAHLLVALLDQTEGLVVPILQRVGADTATIAARASEAVAQLPKLGEGDEPRLSSGLAATLRVAEREMGRDGSSLISTDHLLRALTEDPTAGEILPSKEELDAAVAQVRPEPVTTPNPESTAEALEKFGRDLTADARAGKLDPVIGRDEEIRRVIQVLSRRTKNNPVLIGDPGVGKTAI
ncbi:MAG: hypothetical protein JSS97_18105, partial [Actinobacteria bacterium]|nr:hypothetical protein [Actinomycetota bacterium]